MDAVVDVFTGSTLTTAVSMLNPADAIINIELAGNPMLNRDSRRDFWATSELCSEVITFNTNYYGCNCNGRQN